MLLALKGAGDLRRNRRFRCIRKTTADILLIIHGWHYDPRKWEWQNNNLALLLFPGFLLISTFWRCIWYRKHWCFALKLHSYVVLTINYNYLPKKCHFSTTGISKSIKSTVGFWQKISLDEFPCWLRAYCQIEGGLVYFPRGRAPVYCVLCRPKVFNRCNVSELVNSFMRAIYFEKSCIVLQCD